jgi:hypothetical protein
MASAWREVVFLKILGGNFLILGGGNFPPEVPRINTAYDLLHNITI